MYDLNSFDSVVKPQGGVPSKPTPKEKFDLSSFDNVVKKKEVGTPDLKVGGQVGTSVPQSVSGDKWKDFSFMPEGNKVAESDLDPHDPLLDANRKATIINNQPKNKEGFEQFTKQNSAARDINNVVSRNGFVGDKFVSKVIGDDPNKYSVQQLQYATKDNQTAQAAISGIADKRKVQDAITTTTDPYRAAVKYTTGEENELQHKLTPEETGEAFKNFKNNPNVQEYAKTNHEFNKTFKEAESNWMNNYPSTAQKDIREKIGKKLVDDGKAGLFTVPSNEEIDKAASDVLDNKEMSIYKNDLKPNIGTIKELVNGQTIPTPDIVHTALRAFDRGQGDLYEGTRHFVDNITGGAISAVGEGADARQQRLLENDFSTPQVQPKGDVAKTIKGAVDMAAYMVPSIIASATGAPVMAPMAAQFYGHNWVDGMKMFRDNKEKQEGYATLTTAIDMMAGEKLPIKGIGDKVSSILNDVESGAISKVTGKQRFLNFLGETFQGTNAVKFMGLGQDAAEKVFEGKNIDPEEMVKNAVKTYPKDVIPMAFFSGVHAAVESMGGKAPTETPKNETPIEHPQPIENIESVKKEEPTPIEKVPSENTETAVAKKEQVPQEEVNVLSMLHESKILSPTEKKVLYRQYKNGVMTEGEVSKYTNVDVNDIKSENTDKWAKVVLDKLKGKEISADEIPFEEVSPKTKPIEEQPTEVGKEETPPPPINTEVGGEGIGIAHAATEEVGGEEDDTSIKNETTRLRREQFGLNQEIPTAKKEFGKSWDEAKLKIESGYDPQDLIDELHKKPRPLTDVENAILLHHQNTKEINLLDLNEKINKAAESGDEQSVQEYKVGKARVLDELQRIYDVDKAVGAENARGLASRAMMVDRKYSLANMIAEKRASANDGKPLSEDQQAEVERLHKEIKDTKKEYEDYQKQSEEEIKGLQEKILGKGVRNRKTAAEKLREAADRVEKSTFGKAKLPEGTQKQGASIDINKMVAEGMRLIASGIEKGEDILELVKKAVAHLKEKYPDADEKILGKSINKAVIDSDIIGAKKEDKIYADFIKGGKLDRKALALKANYERAKENADISIKKDELKKRPWNVKAQDVLVKWGRQTKLTNPITMGKLMMAGLSRLTTTPLEDIVGGGVSLVMPKLAKGAIGEGGGLRIRETAEAYKNGLIEGMRDGARIMKTKSSHGKSDLDTVFGRGGTLPPEAAEFFGQLHSATKAPFKRIIFERSLSKRLRRNIANGVDVSDPLVQTEILTGAYKDANRAIFMQDNTVATGFQNLTKYFEKHNAKPIATTMKWLLPFVKVPTNIAAEIGTNVYGIPVGAGKILHATFTKGLENLSADEKDVIFRNLKKGSLGLAALSLGYLNPNTFGGFYQPGQKRKEDEPEALGLKLFGAKIPAWFVESPIFQTMQLGATIRRVKDEKVKGEEKGLSEGLWAGALGLAGRVPMLDQPVRMGKIFGNPADRKYYFGQLAQSSVDPALLTYFAKVTDPLDQRSVGEKIIAPENKRKPTTMLEYIKNGIPLLNTQVGEKPQAKEGKFESKSHKTTKHN